MIASVSAWAGCSGRGRGRRRCLDGDLPKRLALDPGRLALLVELEQREQGHRDGDAVGAGNGLVEAKAPAGEQLSQVSQALGDRDLGKADMAQVHRLWHP